jgi:protein YibB
MTDITIVTAFYDIGRENFPGFERTSDTYLNWFANLATLDNDMIIFTTDKYADKIKEVRGNKPTTVIVFDAMDYFSQELTAIKSVHNNNEFRKQVRADLRHHIEYWCAEYTLINCVKAALLNKAVHDGLVNNELVAWVDFGYCRSPAALRNVNKWQYNFKPDKVHFFALRPIPAEVDISSVIFNNIVYAIGGVVVCGKDMCEPYWEVTKSVFNELIDQNMIDDDQSIIALLYTKHPAMFAQHKLPIWSGVFQKFQKFNR